MADLGNSKIKDTYTLVLQTDASGNLQNLDGTTPSPFIVNGNLRYVDGNQALNYVLTSDASGNASWSESGGVSYWSANTDGSISTSGNSDVRVSGDVYTTGNIYSGSTNLLDIFATSDITNQDVYWSANTDGSISPSGLTTSIGVGTVTPNKPLTVVGDISGTTDLYLGSSTNTGSTIAAQEQLTIKGRGVDNDYMILRQDQISFMLDGSSYASMTSTSHPSVGGGVQWNVSGQEYGFDILGGDATPIFQLTGVHGENRIRIRDHLIIGKNEAVSHADAVKWGLAVTGSSLFYSGGTIQPNEAIVAGGNISGTTDLYIDQNTFIGGVLHVSGDTFYEGALSGTGNITTVGDLFATNITASNNLYISGDTHHEGAFSATGSITTSENLYVSGNTFYEGALSGTGDITTVGDTYTTDLVLDGGKVRPASSGGEVIFANADHGSADWLTLSQDQFIFKFNGLNSFSLDPDDIVFNIGNSNQSFRVMSDGGAESISNNASCDLLALGQSGGTSIGGTTSRWPTVNGAPTSLPLKTLQVNGITTIYSGGTGNLWSADTTALTVIGDISGTTDLYVDQDVMVGGALHVSGTTYHEGAFSATGSITTTENLYVSGDTFYEGQLSGTGNITTTENLHVSGNSFYDGALSVSQDAGQVYINTGNVEITGNFIADGTSNDLELKNAGETNILLKGRPNQNSYIGGHSGWNAYFGVGTTTPNVALTVRGDISGATDLSLARNIYVSGDTFYEGALSGTGDITTTGNVYVEDTAGVYTDKIRRYSDSDNTTKILLNDEVLKLHAGHSTEEVVNISSGIVLVDGSLNITGNTFYEGTLSGTGSITTTNKISAGTDPVEPEDVVTLNYLTGSSSYQYITFLGNTGALGDDNWQTPGTNGISNHTWGTDAGADGTTTGSTTIAIARTSQHTGIRIPAGTRLVGVEGTVRSNTNDDAYYGIFTYLPDYEGPDDSTATLRILAQTPSSSNNVTNDPQNIKQYASPADQHVFADGEMIMPAMRRGSTSSQTLVGSWTIILQR